MGKKLRFFVVVKFYIAAATCSSFEYCTAFREISERARDSRKEADGHNTSE
jgi:hypothetical protein